MGSSIYYSGLKRRFSAWPRQGSWALVAFLCLAAPGVRADEDIFVDALLNGWQDWSYRAARNFANSSPIHSGSKSISVTATNYGALSLHAPAQDSSLFTNLTFWINGGATGGQSVYVQATLGGAAQPGVLLAPLPTNSWRQITLSLLQLRVTNAANLDGFWIQVQTNGVMPTFYVDDISLVSAPTAPVTNTPFTVLVDAAADRHMISPLIYGVAFAGSNELKMLNAPLNRQGGNATSRYNWQTNGSNHAMDWYFESLPERGSGPGAMADLFVQDSKNGGAQALLTVPINGWVAKLGPNRGKLASFSISKYGPQTDNDWEWMPDAGNGIATNGLSITNNDPADANMAVGTNFQTGWLAHLTNRWGAAANGGVRYYCMDNEWGLWHETHRDVWPVGATMEQMRDRFCDYATMVRGNDPDALVLGPEEWGWSGYLYSGYDAQWGSRHGWGGPLPDRTAHGNQDFTPWWLDQVRQRSQTAGRRLLDCFTLHYYPQGGEFSTNTTEAMQLRRNRSTRSLWDTNYTDESWINAKVKLIPRMKAWATNYPGTPIGLTEYNWGAEGHMNGATAQADVLGILGREGADLATRWTTPPSNTPTFKAMQMYRNYDGKQSIFGDISIRASGANPDQLAVFAAVRTNLPALTVMAINKQLTNPAPLTLQFTNVAVGGVAQAWQLTSNNVITSLPGVALSNGTLTNTLPAQSITLFIIPTAPRLTAVPATPATMNLSVLGIAGQSYVIQTSTNLRHWLPYSTNVAVSNTLTVPLATAYPAAFFRSRLLP